MVTVSVNEARRKLADLINSVAQGQHVAITRRGKPVVQLSAIRALKRPHLPDLSDFRASLGKTPARSTATIRHLRQQERY